MFEKEAYRPRDGRAGTGLGADLRRCSSDSDFACKLPSWNSAGIAPRAGIPANAGSIAETRLVVKTATPSKVSRPAEGSVSALSLEFAISVARSSATPSPSARSRVGEDAAARQRSPRASDQPAAEFEPPNVRCHCVACSVTTITSMGECDAMLRRKSHSEIIVHFKHPNRVRLF